MKDMGITDYEPKVINQLLEFSYRYVSTILDDSKTFAMHSKKKFIDLDDVCLAVSMQSEKSYTNPPPREVMVDLAKVKNNVPLPDIRSNLGLKLPPRYLLNSANLKLKTPPKKLDRISGDDDSNKSFLGKSIVKRPATICNRTQIISVPKPVLKVDMNDQNTIDTQIKPNMPLTPQAEQGLLPMMKTEPGASLKRKREDDNYDVP